MNVQQGLQGESGGGNLCLIQEVFIQRDGPLKIAIIPDGIGGDLFEDPSEVRKGPFRFAVLCFSFLLNKPIRDKGKQR